MMANIRELEQYAVIRELDSHGEAILKVVPILLSINALRLRKGNRNRLNASRGKLKTRPLSWGFQAMYTTGPWSDDSYHAWDGHHPVAIRGFKKTWSHLIEALDLHELLLVVRPPCIRSVFNPCGWATLPGPKSQASCCLLDLWPGWSMVTSKR